MLRSDGAEKRHRTGRVNSDIITYHSYDELEKHSRIIELLKTNGRIICTEYMARTRNNTFNNTP